MLKSDRPNPGRCSDILRLTMEILFYRWLLILSIIILIISAKEIIPEFVSIVRASMVLKDCIDVLHFLL